MRTAFVAGNWKMNGSRESAVTLAQAISDGYQAATDGRVDVAICPPFVFLAEVGTTLAGSGVELGAQNVSEHDAGAYTGEIAAAMLGAVGCRLAIVGHSERRQLYHESDDDVAAKFDAARRGGLVPILCVGETLEEREAGETGAVVSRQLGAVLAAHGAGAFDGAVLAYEPVWAIGTGRTATPEQAQTVHSLLRETLRAADEGLAARVRILYGGSVKSANAATLFAMPDIDGGLIGGASLDPAEFLAICRAALESDTATGVRDA